MTHILSALTERVDNIPNRWVMQAEVETQRKNQKEMLEIKNTVTEINAFDGLISR